MDFDRLPREIAPPPGLEARTVAALGRENLLRSRPASSGPGRWRLAAAALVIFACGMAAGRAIPTAANADARPRFVLLLQSGPTPASAEEGHLAVDAYRAWARGLRAEGRFVAGERLDDRTAVVPAAAGPSAPLQGYFVISANSFEDAVAVAQTCPHVARGGRIVVRPVAPT